MKCSLLPLAISSLAHCPIFRSASLGAPHRRTIYLASIEAHIDSLHSHLLERGFYPVKLDALQPYKGLNCKTAKGMVAGLQHDIVCARKYLQDTHKAVRLLRSFTRPRLTRVSSFFAPQMEDLKKEYEEAREAQPDVGSWRRE